MIEVLIFFIAASLLLYVVLGGADYGAGILELLPSSYREEQRKVVNNAMGPVWEANHMWLILIVVILFVGFPLIFNIVMVSLHIPMVALLLGIVVRGTAFTFRHYDAVTEPRSQNFYSYLFGYSSLWTSFWLGVIGASLERGRIDPAAVDFFDAYVAPWWGLFPVSVGIFVCTIFAFLASVYLIGETDSSALQALFRRRAFVLNIAMVAAGILVFIASYLEGTDLLSKFWSHPFSYILVLLVSCLFVVLWIVAVRRRPIAARIVAATQAGVILSGWYLINAPGALNLKSGSLSFYDAAATAGTLNQLALALLIGSLLIFPSLFYLLRVFKK